MPKKADGSLAGTFRYVVGGPGGGGYAGKRSMADDGVYLLSTDLAGIGTYFVPANNQHRQLLRYGDNIPVSESVFRAPASHFYNVAVCPTNSQVFAFTRHGRIYRSLDQGATVTKCSSYNGGNTDATWAHDGHASARNFGRTSDFDPVNANVLLIGHPEKGMFLCTNFTGTTPTFALIASLPIPVFGADNRFGAQCAFDRSTSAGGTTGTVYVFINGSGFYRSTTGATGAFTSIGGPLSGARDMRAAGGRLWVCTNGQELWKYDGAAWTRQAYSGGTFVEAATVAIDPADPNSLFAVRFGGDAVFSTDGGTTWDGRGTNWPMSVDPEGSADPWTSQLGYVSPGMADWERRTGVNRVRLSTGNGEFYLDNPPRLLVTQKWKSQSKGLLQLLMMGGKFSSDGRLITISQDRPIWHFEKGKWFEPSTGYGPNYEKDIVHAGDVGFLEGNSSFVIVTTKPQDGNGALTRGLYRSAQGGRIGTWEGVPTPADLYGGNCVPFSTTNYVWLPTSNAAPLVTTNAGTSWQSPTFRHTSGGAVIDMTGASGHLRYELKRKVLIKIPGQANTALLYLVTGNANQVGIWKTTDGGANFLRIFAGYIFPVQTVNIDGYSASFETVSAAYPDCIFWAIGNSDGPFAPATHGGRLPSDTPPRLSVDGGASWNALVGFEETHRVAVGPSDKNADGTPTNPFGWVLVTGFRGGQRGVWLCKNATPSDPTGAGWTWELDVNFPFGRDDVFMGVEADKNTPDRFLLYMDAGGFGIRDYYFPVKAA